MPHHAPRALLSIAEGEYTTTTLPGVAKTHDNTAVNRLDRLPLPVRVWSNESSRMGTVAERRPPPRPLGRTVLPWAATSG